MAPPTLQGVSFFRTEMDGRNCRMAVVAQSEEEALTVIERSASLAEAGIASPKALRSLAQQGIFMSREDLPVLPLAFVFPGQGSQYEGMGTGTLRVLSCHQGVDGSGCSCSGLLHFSPSLIVHDPEGQPSQDLVAAACHVRHGTCHGSIPHHPQSTVAMAGHSLGELTALRLAGVYSPEDGFRMKKSGPLARTRPLACT